MKKKIVLMFFLLSLSLFKVTVLSQTSPTPIPTKDPTASDLGAPYNLECVQATTNPPAGSGPPKGTVAATFTGTCSSNQPCKVVACEGKTNCTTYDKALDLKYFGGSGSDLPNVIVNGANPHQFPPGKINITGTISGAKGHVPYSIYALSEPEIRNMGAGGITGTNTSEQQAALPIAPPIPANAGKSCVSVYWDPYGRVFDAVSLEPLAAGQARVSLLDENGVYLNLPSNNTPIDNMGKYNIFVDKDGMYKLSVGSMTTHDFVAVTPDPKYVSLYGTIYKAGDPAFAENKTDPQRIDIPVKPKTTPLQRPVEWLYKDQSIIQINGEDYADIEFRVTHPLTKIKTNMVGEQPKCQQTNADYTNKDGYCTLIIREDLIPQEGLNIDLIKNPNFYLTAKNNFFANLVDKFLSLLVKPVHAQQSIRIESTGAVVSPTVASQSALTFAPILRFIEGYAYDQNGKIIPNAKIEVRYVTTDKVYYRTTADSQGFFTIFRNNLPPLEYYLKIINPATSMAVNQTTAEFAKSNSTFLTAEKIDLVKATQDGKPIINPLTGKANTELKNHGTTNISVTPIAGASGKTALNSNMLLVLLVILVLVALVVGLVLYMKNKQQAPQQNF